MKPCNQTKDWTVCLFGRVLPKFIFYGKVNNKIFTCDIFTGIVETGRGHYYNISLYNGTKWISTDTKKHGDIFLAIEKYCRENEIHGEKIEVCQHRTDSVRQGFYVAKNIQAKKARKAAEERRELLSCGPQERRNILSASGAAPHTFMNEGGRIETDRVWEDVKNPNPIPAEYKDAGYLQNFEMGQCTAGIAGKYTRSGWEVKREGLKVDMTKVRPNTKNTNVEKIKIHIENAQTGKYITKYI